VIYRTYTPRAPLADFVHSIWYCEGYNAPHTRERVLPDGTMQIIISLADDEIPTYCGPKRDELVRMPGAILAGASSEYVVIDTRSLAAMIGVHFRPGGAVPFLRVRADETCNRDVPLDAIWGREANEVRARLLETPTISDKFRILENALSARLARTTDVDGGLRWAITQFDRLPHTRTIADVANSIVQSA
jgi:hypothetical protein